VNFSLIFQAQRSATLPFTVTVFLRILPAFSIGIAELQPGQDAQTLLEAADRQLLRAKGQGRGRAML